MINENRVSNNDITPKDDANPDCMTNQNRINENPITIRDITEYNNCVECVSSNEVYETLWSRRNKMHHKSLSTII